MVHNGIEYADMQLIAEAYDLLRGGRARRPRESPTIFREWNKGDLDSFLIEITAEVLDHVDASTGKPFVDVIVDAAEQKGTGRWTVQIALELGVPVSGIAEAVFARSASGRHRQREARRPVLAGPDAPHRRRGPAAASSRTSATRSVRLEGGRLRPGPRHDPQASEEYDWDVDIATVARIWRGGCIIRARLLAQISDAYAAGKLATLLVAPSFASGLADRQDAWRRVVALGTTAGVPVPGFSSALAYYDTLRAERLPAALVQGLRDNFGAHTYGRIDREGTFHTLWSGDRTEVAAP